MSEPELRKLAKAIRAMTWRDLTKVSEHLAAQYVPLKNSDKLDRDGMAEVLHDMASEILKEGQEDVLIANLSEERKTTNSCREAGV